MLRYMLWAGGVSSSSLRKLPGILVVREGVSQQGSTAVIRASNALVALRKIAGSRSRRALTPFFVALRRPDLEGCVLFCNLNKEGK